MRVYKFFFPILLIFAGFAVASIPAQAAEPGRDVVYLEPVVVTAQKTEADKQSIPASISVFGTKQIEDTGATKIDDLVKFVLNLSFNKLDAHTTQFTFRSIGGVANMNKIWNTLI